MPAKSILFDAVGTLLYAEPSVINVYASVAGRHGVKLTDDAIEKRFRTSFHRVFGSEAKQDRPCSHAEDQRRWQCVVAETFPEAGDATPIFEELWQHFAKATSWRLFPDVEPAWRAAERLGYRVGVASNYDDRILLVAAGHELLAGCDLLFHSAGLGYAKPDVRFFREIESRLELSPSEITLIGDDWENDYLGAIAAGWNAYFLDRTGVSNDGAFCFESLADVVNAISK